MPSNVLCLLTIAAASSVALAASGCNSSYNATTAPACIIGCNKKSGQSLWPEWTDDPASSNFINSLAFQCEKGTPNYMAFMTSAGMCMTSCSSDDQAAFKTEFQQACQWYTSHSNDTCSGSSSNSSSASSTTATSGSVNLQISDLVTVCAIVVGLGLL